MNCQIIDIANINVSLNNGAFGILSHLTMEDGMDEMDARTARQRATGYVPKARYRPSSNFNSLQLISHFLLVVT